MSMFPLSSSSENRNDGNEPNYMAADPVTWLSSSMQSCCKKWFFGPLYHKCIAKYPVTNVDDCVETLWYPDWDKSNKGCVDDGKRSIMTKNSLHFYSAPLAKASIALTHQLRLLSKTISL